MPVTIAMRMALTPRRACDHQIGRCEAHGRPLEPMEPRIQPRGGPLQRPFHPVET